MAVNINSVYQKVLTLLNKEQRGYLTPQEFNLLADRAQNEIYENYFHQVRNSNAKIKDDSQYSDTLEMIEAKLSPFFTTQANTTISSGVLTFPSNVYKLISITTGVGKIATELNKEEQDYILGFSEQNNALYPNSKRPVYSRRSATTILITPAPGNGTSIEVCYYKEPTAPSWGYVVVNEKALYNTNTSVNFELNKSEEEPLVSKILMLSGVVAKQQDIGTVGANAIQMTNQEQNS